MGLLTINSCYLLLRLLYGTSIKEIPCKGYAEHGQMEQILNAFHSRVTSSSFGAGYTAKNTLKQHIKNIMEVMEAKVDRFSDELYEQNQNFGKPKEISSTGAIEVQDSEDAQFITKEEVISVLNALKVYPKEEESIAYHAADKAAKEDPLNMATKTRSEAVSYFHSIINLFLFKLKKYRYEQKKQVEKSLNAESVKLKKEQLLLKQTVAQGNNTFQYTNIFYITFLYR